MVLWLVSLDGYKESPISSEVYLMTCIPYEHRVSHVSKPSTRLSSKMELACHAQRKMLS